MPTPRKKATRPQRLARRLKRTRTRWKRRARTARNAYRKTRAGAQALRRAPGKARRKIRATVTPNKTVQCSCGEAVPSHRMQAHLDRHEKRAKAAQRRAEKKRRQAAERPDRPSRVEAAKTASPWIAVGGVMIAAPLSLGVGGGWLGVAGGAVAAVGGAAYAAERKWGTGQQGTKATRRATRKAAKQAGCSGACMHSTKPRNTCDCHCRGATHGSLAGVGS